MALLALLVAGCGSSSEGDPKLDVYVSAPLTGPRADDGRDVADGAQLALEDAGGEAGGVEVSLEVLDDATREGWDAAATGANARTATEDTAAIAYIGELDSGASRTSIPITNQAGMLQVSPGAGAEDLTRESLGSDDVPDVQGTGERTFARVIPSDRAQGEAGAAWMSSEGVGSVVVSSDESDYAAALVSGLEAASDGPEIVSGDAAAGAVYIAAADAFDSPPAAGFGERGIYGSDAQLDGGARLVSGSTPVRLTSAAMDPTQLPAEAAGFLSAFEEAYERKPGRYAAYGYEAMAATLDAIDRADDQTDRSDVVDAFMAISNRESILGTYSIDGVGNTTLDTQGAYEIGRRGDPEPLPEAITVP